MYDWIRAYEKSRGKLTGSQKVRAGILAAKYFGDYFSNERKNCFEQVVTMLEQDFEEYQKSKNDRVHWLNTLVRSMKGQIDRMTL